MRFREFVRRKRLKKSKEEKQGLNLFAYIEYNKKKTNDTWQMI